MIVSINQLKLFHLHSHIFLLVLTSSNHFTIYHLLHFETNSELPKFKVDLPSTVTNLSLLGMWNGDIDNLPCNPTILHLGNMFNQPVDRLPSSVRELQFGTKFDQLTICHHL